MFARVTVPRVNRIFEVHHTAFYVDKKKRSAVLFCMSLGNDWISWPVLCASRVAVDVIIVIFNNIVIFKICKVIQLWITWNSLDNIAFIWLKNEKDATCITRFFRLSTQRATAKREAPRVQPLVTHSKVAPLNAKSAFAVIGPLCSQTLKIYKIILFYRLTDTINWLQTHPFG